MRVLAEFLKKFVEYYGGVTEEKEGDVLEVIFPKTIAASLNVPEFTTFYLDSQTAPEGETALDLHSPFIDRIGEFMEGKLRHCKTKLKVEIGSYNSSRLEEIALRRFPIRNASIRFGNLQEGIATYSLFHFRYRAISDEKKENVLSILVNEKTHFKAEILQNYIVPGNLQAISDEFPSLPKAFFHFLQNQVHLQIKEDIADFVRGLQRRLDRDKRLALEYFTSLVKETEKRIEKFRLKGDIEGIRREEGRIKVIEMEADRKLQDLAKKYEVYVQIEPLAWLRFAMPVVIAELEIRRKKQSRQVEVCWLPLSRTMERVGCEHCGASDNLLVCDDKLHIISERCLRKCPNCGYTYCPLCHFHKCPKCKTHFSGGQIRF